MKGAAAKSLFLIPVMMFSQAIGEGIGKHAIEVAELRREAAPRPLVLFITADWCSYCKLMKKKVFTNAELANKIESEFYFAELDGEFSEPISWAGRTYRFSPSGLRTGTHELALHLGAVNGKLSYPTLVILDENGKVIFRYGGFLTAMEMFKILDTVKSER